MSISIENLSLLGSLAPLRHTSATSGVPKENGFTHKLDKALGNGESPASSASGNARELAESLTLQMLQSSLSLGGDPSSADSATSNFSQLPSTKALLHAYQSNRATSGDPSSPLPVSPVSPLQDVASSTPVAAVVVPSSPLRADATWLDPIISRASQKYGVNADLIRAVIKAESNFNPQAVSHAGARGLMQLMPATARSLGVSDSFDPEQNVMGGTRFLKDMLQRYNGDVDSALAAYNWGPGNVDKRPDRLPHETRDYLARVKQLYASYTG